MPKAGDLAPYLKQIDASRWYTNFGPLLGDFEERLAAKFATPVVTAANGTVALTLALQAMAPSAGGLCAMPAWTFAASAHAAIAAGLRPWFVDVDPATWMLDPAFLAAELEHAPGPVAVVMPTAAYGRVPDLDAWARFRAETGVPVLVDGAAAFDALAAAPVPVMVSLHATKVLGVGEGGLVAAPDPALLSDIRQRASFGFRGDRTARFAATNAKLSEYAAAVGLASLEAWPVVRMRYMRVAQLLRIALSRVPEVSFQPGWGADWIASVCVVRLPDGAADAVEAALAAEGVQTRRWWGLGCHRQPAFADAARRYLPATELLACSTLGLPFHAELTSTDVNRIAAAVRQALARA